MSRRFVASRSALTAAACLAALTSSPLDAAPAAARLEYKLPKRTTLGEPVIFIARLRNTTGNRIVADLGLDDQTQFSFRLTDPNGRTTNVQPQPQSLPTTPARSRHTIARDTAYTAAVVLDPLLNFPQEGRYQLEVEFRGPVALASGDQAGLNRTARLSMDVTPRNVKQLDKRNREWLKLVSAQSPTSEARAAAVALSRVHDPIAVPYLEQALARTRWPIFADALRAIGGAEARAALERLAIAP